jgi:Zn-finger protein
MTERSLQGNTIITCNECGWSHSEPNYKCLNFDGMYDNGCAEYNRSMVSKPEQSIAYPNEKSERELLEDILAELKEIKHVLLSTERERY